jgi:hypothetical protein
MLTWLFLACWSKALDHSIMLTTRRRSSVWNVHGGGPKVIFPLGCCDHNSFSFKFFQLGVLTFNLTALLVKHWQIAGALRAMSQTVTHHAVNDVCPFRKKMRTCVSKVTYFQQTCSSPMESQWPCSKKQGPMSLAFHCAAVITSHCDQSSPM